jgi:probable HAF family extracellular repeat protein
VLPIGTAAINESGQVAGTYCVSTPCNSHAAIWTPGSGVLDLGTLGGTSSYAFAINNAGQVAGYSYTAADAERHAFLWTPGHGMQDLGTLGGPASFARGINDTGEVVGDSYLPGGGTHAFLWTPGRGMQDLGAMPGSWDRTSSIAHDINNAGQVVGESINPVLGEMGSRAFLWTGGAGMRDLGSLGLPGSTAYAINDAGHVVGWSWTALGPHHAFLWTPEKGMLDLGTLVPAGMNSRAWAINNAGHVVGSSNTTGDYGNHAFLWTAADGMQDLYPVTGITVAVGINDREQVIGAGRLATLQLASPNRAPVATVGGPYTGAEGSAVLLAFSATDPDGDVLTYAWDLGDGTTGSGPAPPATHVYADNGTYRVRLTVSDGKSGGEKETTASVANVAPAISAGGLTGPLVPTPVAAASLGMPITVAFADPAGPTDTYRAEIRCGNGVTLTPHGITSPYTGMCPYTTAGVYAARVTVWDEDGGASTPAFYRYVVVYDPDGPFTTGSGFVALDQGSRKSHITITAKFLPGRPSTPNGSAKFWIPGGSVDFESTAIEMLVASATRAQFWGTGLLNGAPAQFRITAVDADDSETPDAFRIELWRSGTLVFDTQPGAAQDASITTRLAGGHIQVHR